MLCLLAGCYSTIRPMYGMQPLYGIIPGPHDPEAQLLDFSYTPASPVKYGSEVIFKAHSNKTFYAGAMLGEVGNGNTAHVYLNDRGQAPDAVALDGEWTGRITWGTKPTSEITLPVSLRLIWDDGAPGQVLTGDDLTVQP
jgi:hypothetical protein